MNALTSQTGGEGGGGISTEIALARMYCQRLLLESWTQSHVQVNLLNIPKSLRYEKDPDNNMDETFLSLAVADCFGPLHATAERSCENLGASSASGITNDIQGVMSYRFQSPDLPNRGDLLCVLEALPRTEWFCDAALVRSAKIMFVSP